jgi:hypothetical protein
MIRMSEGQFRLFEESRRAQSGRARAPRQQKPKQQLPENIVEEQILGFLRARGWMVTRVPAACSTAASIWRCRRYCVADASYSDFISVHASGPGIGLITKDYGTGKCWRKGCGQEFKKNAHLHRYCSNECRRVAHAEMQKKYAQKRKAAKKNG